jgi:ribosomal protein L11 methylase PrmA
VSAGFVRNRQILVDASAVGAIRILDLGCGTGVLAIAAAKLWHTPVLATDIDSIAVEVAREERPSEISVAPLVPRRNG